MTVRLTRLRIAGFKSFAEPVTLEFADGLTGIVGPNGCGKSNVVEALRWVMGESSARSLRGGEMDDVIFAGTAHRPSRNLAEVSLTLEPGDRPAPHPWQDAPELEISRKLARGGGSVFRVNGREVRARDLGTLLNDLGSGAGSAALVGQGRVAALIGAKPAERRAVLEEAAGITGLAARRHEAEAKLRAADANLVRSDDALGQLRARASALAGQAEVAVRYRALTEAIRAAEADSLLLARATAARAVAAAAAASAAAETVAIEAVHAATRAASALAAANAALPGCRAAEAAARDTTGAAKTTLALLAAEAAQAAAARSAARTRAEALARDVAAADRILRDAGAATDRLDAELAALATAHAPEAVTQARAAADAAARAARAADQAATGATERAAAAAAHRQAADAALAAAERRCADATRAQHTAATALAHVIRDSPLPDAVHAALGARDGADQASVQSREAAEAADAARDAAAEGLAHAQATAAAAAAAHDQVSAERASLLAALAPAADGRKATPIADRMVVPPGLEAAVSGAFGETLVAGTDPAGGMFWDAAGGPEPQGGPDAPTPDAPTLGTLVQAPAELSRALGHVALVADDAEPVLAPGWTAVRRDGSARRWDGFHVRPGAASPAIVLRLSQNNRLRHLEQALPDAAAADAAAQATLLEARAQESRAVAARAQARVALRDADAAARAAQAAFARTQERAVAAHGAQAAARDRAETSSAALSDAAAALDRARAVLTALPDLADIRAAQTQARQRLETARRAEQEASRRVGGLIRAADDRARRAQAATAERAEWMSRHRLAAEQAVALADRAAAADAECLEHAPEGLAARLREAQDAAAAAAGRAAGAAAALRVAEDRAADADQGARGADRAAAAARDGLARAREHRAAAAEALRAAEARVTERLGAGSPPALTQPRPEEPAEPHPDGAARAQRRHDRLVRERDALGAVNLLADTELAEVTGRIERLTAEAAELATAIAKLRGSIGHLNREGREKLSGVFAAVDQHFQALFGRLFQGGRAHLALTGADDPLAAGLELFVQPPGKKLATLSLLSGGEQALTALCLVFAIFRCNPAPVCVLDEVDAPLDDANVDRFCTLIADLARETATRFLVVTHHPQTMARTDRLFGVTMQERGVSRLLSVDLGTAQGMADVRMAAE